MNSFHISVTFLCITRYDQSRSRSLSWWIWVMEFYRSLGLYWRWIIYTCSWVLATHFRHCLFDFCFSLDFHFSAIYPSSSHFLARLSSSHLSQMFSFPIYSTSLGDLVKIPYICDIQTVHSFLSEKITKNVLFQPLEPNQNNYGTVLVSIKQVK